MNTSSFFQLLKELSISDWQALLDGKGLRIIDDRQLKVSSTDDFDVITHGTVFDSATPNELKQKILENAEELLANYYRVHPLTKNGFNHQVKNLVGQHGMHAFIALPDQQGASFTLFVEGGEVVAESATSPRHPYGVFMALTQKLPEEKLEKAFNQWLSSGEAYDQYLGMNVCRYNC